MASSSASSDILQCPVCYHAFDGRQRRPWDLGCGHCFCERCLKDHPRSFRDCPECRVRTNNPHVSVTLLRLVDAQPSSGSNGAAQGEQRQQQHDQQQRPAPTLQQPPGRRAAGAERSPVPLSHPPASGLSPLLQPASGHIAGHQQQLAAFKSSMWAYVTPFLGLIYMLSPLDIIPDIIPVIGWMDDLLVLMYVVWVVWGMINAQSHSSHGDAPHRNWPR